MNARRSLPVADLLARRPTMEALRKRLGGRAASEAGVGACVTLPSVTRGEALGVVLFVAGDALDVWTPGNVVRRVARAVATPAHGVVPADIAAVAADARAFASLREGERVRFDPGDGSFAEALLMEKCRYGALLARDDGALVGVGFRRLWPLAATGSHAPS